jgi:hypothetical protein
MQHTNLPKYSMGVGDRFGREGRHQLAAFVKAREHGVRVAPVWNKSNREHRIVGTIPSAVRAEADAAVRAAGWTDPYYVDADHVSLKTVKGFLESSDFFTLDVADVIGKPADDGAVAAFVGRHRPHTGELRIPGLREPLNVTEPVLSSIARRYLLAVQEAGRIYRRIEAARGRGGVVTEVSMDETDQPQTPIELLFILAAVAAEGIPAQTIAPRFSGRFNKGVDYVGDPAAFEREFDADLAVVAFAVREFGLPAGLKLSVHSGSDKFTLYAPMRRALRRHDAGLHLKTAGTTWLEELTGLALAGGEGLRIAREIYAGALARFDEMCTPYASVVAIDRGRLPSAETVNGWSSDQFAAALRHDPACPAFNPHVRQLLHVGYRIAAEMGLRFTDALERHAGTIGPQVTANLWERHLRPLFAED